MAATKRRRRKGFRMNAKRRRTRRNYYGAGVLANPHKRRSKSRRRFAMNRTRRRRSHHFRRNVYMTPMLNKRHKRRFKRNPAGEPRGLTIMGVSLPPLQDIAWVAAGYVVPRIVSSYIMPYVPTTFSTNYPQATTLLVKAISVLVPSMLVRRFVSRRAGNMMLVGGLASFAVDLITAYMPGVIPGLGAQPGLGAYFTRPVAGVMRRIPPPSRIVPQQIADIPDRLAPQGRF